MRLLRQTTMLHWAFAAWIISVSVTSIVLTSVWKNAYGNTMDLVICIQVGAILHLLPIFGIILWFIPSQSLPSFLRMTSSLTLLDLLITIACCLCVARLG